MTTQQDMQDSGLRTEDSGLRTPDSRLRSKHPASKDQHSGPRTPHAFATFSTFLHFTVNGFIFSPLSPTPQDTGIPHRSIERESEGPAFADEQTNSNSELI